VTWLFVLIAVVVALSLAFYINRRTRSPLPNRSSGRREMEASTEIGIPPEEIDPEESLKRDRLAGVERPKVGGSRALGALKQRNLRKDNLSKEVELAWEASETIEFQPGAYAWPRDFIGEDRTPTGRGERIKPRSPKAFREEDYFLPKRYGVDRLVLLARDPQWVYAYWEITHEKYRNLVGKRLAEWGFSKPALRLYDVTYGLPPAAHMDVIVGENADNWYIHVDRPRHTIVAEYGRLFEGEFVPFLRSNPITLPPRNFSMEAADEWAIFDWAKLYGRYSTRHEVSSPMLWRQ
jgi:HAMP domain-containing protein